MATTSPRAGETGDRRGRTARGGRPVDRRAGVQRGRRARPLSRRPGRGGAAVAPDARTCDRSDLCRRRQPRRQPRGRATACRPRRSTSRCVSLSRNFGKEAALMAGLDHARLGAVLFMDGDGQHPPALIPTLVGHWLDDGYDVVFTAKAHRENEPLAAPRSACRSFYGLINWGARQRIPEDAGDFRLLSPRAADALRRLAASATASSRAWRAGSASGSSGSTTSRPSAPMARTSWNLYAPDRPVDRGADLVLGGAAAAREPARPAARGRRAGVRRHRSCSRRSSTAISVAGYPSVDRRPDGAGRRAAHHDRRHRRVHRQDPVRDQSAAGLFRRRAQRADGARTRATAAPPARAAAE